MLTPQTEEYVEAVYRLGGAEREVPLADLAEHMGLAAASVNEMVRRLADQGLLTYTPYHGVTLSEEGRCEALAVLRRHRLWERFLTDMLELPWDVVHAEACRLEHAASERVTERLARLLANPQYCPHGRPLPPPDCGPVPVQDALSLAQLAVGQSARVAYIAQEEPELLRYLEGLGIRPGVGITLQSATPFEGPLTVKVEDAPQVLGHKAALAIFVRANEHPPRADATPSAGATATTRQETT
jgi:DtxR family Mn-dependent transcriptional regulator